MLLEMTTGEMIDHLGLMTEDEGHVRNTELIKQRALNNATLALCQMLRNEYLQELKVLAANQALTAGKFALSGLDYTVLRSGAGILEVKIKDGKWCTKQELEDQKITEHPMLKGSDRNPLYMIHENSIIVSTDTATHIDIYYIRCPNPLLYSFTLAAAGTPSTTKFVGPASKGLIETNDYYDNAVVYITQESFFAAVKNYVGATREFEIFRNDAAANLTTGSFYFATSPFKITGLDNHFCELNPSLHPLVLIQAEAELWARDKALDRKEAALGKVKEEVAILNARYEPSPGIGRRKPEGRE